MEPRKGAERRLAPKANAASARTLLALAAAALLAVAGCGGDSDPEPVSPPSPPAQAGAMGATGPSPGAATKSSGPSSASNSSSGGTASDAGQKQGSSVPLPKGDRVPEATPAEEAQATVADIALTSPAVDPSTGALPAPYTCDGKDNWPTLRWHGAPADTREMALFAMNSQPVQGKLFFDWALAGIDPALGEIEAGRVPRSAVSGRNSFGEVGYSICPAQGEAETYVFALYALPDRLSPAKGFDPAELRRRVQELSRNVGLLAASYAR